METMTAICGYCGKQYVPKRETSKFCSDACRSKSHKKEKKATAANAPVSGVLLVEQAWIPSKRERILNKVIADSDLAICKILLLVMKLESSAIVEEIALLAIQTSIATFHNEIRKEVDGFNMAQRIQDGDVFESRTGTF